MNLDEAKQLRHGDRVTDYKIEWVIGISPSFPRVLHFWIGKTESYVVDLNNPTAQDLKFISKIEKL